VGLEDPGAVLVLLDPLRRVLDAERAWRRMMVSGASALREVPALRQAVLAALEVVDALESVDVDVSKVARAPVPEVRRCADALLSALAGVDDSGQPVPGASSAVDAARAKVSEYDTLRDAWLSAVKARLPAKCYS
jgi:hypothetical protein